MKVPFSLVLAGMLAGIGFLICAPLAFVWTVLHDEPEFDETW